MFKFDYVPEEQLKTFVEFTPGRASFEIISWTDSRDGNKMFTQNGAPRVDIIMNINDSTGTEGKYFDMLTPNMNWKLKSILDSVGLSDLYSSSGMIDLNKLIKQRGLCNLTPPTGDYKKLNIQYLTPKQAEKPYIQHAAPLTHSAKATPKPVTAEQLAEYDEVPF